MKTNLTEKEIIVINHIENNIDKYPFGFWAENLIDVLGWDKTVRYPERRYRLACYAFMQRLVRKKIVKRVYDFDSHKHSGYKLI